MMATKDHGRATLAAAFKPEAGSVWAALYAAACRNSGYNPALVSDVLRLIRNTSAEFGHYAELPAALRTRIEAGGGLARLVLDRFPGLVVAASRMEQHLDEENGGGPGGGGGDV